MRYRTRLLQPSRLMAELTGPLPVRVAEYRDQRRSIQTTSTMITIRTMVPRPIYMVSSPTVASVCAGVLEATTRPSPD